ncbi:hypothetical protein D3C75_1235640 [compost metagenome]
MHGFTKLRVFEFYFANRHNRGVIPDMRSAKVNGDVLRIGFRIEFVHEMGRGTEEKRPLYKVHFLSLLLAGLDANLGLFPAEV